jgi:hypothetical protein
MALRQPDFCTYREIKLLALTFNIDSAKPHDLSGSDVNLSFMDELLNSVDSPDIITVGFQEVIPLTDKKLTASTSDLPLRTLGADCRNASLWQQERSSDGRRQSQSCLSTMGRQAVLRDPTMLP